MAELTDTEILEMSDEDFENLQSNSDEIAEEAISNEDDNAESAQEETQEEVVSEDSEVSEETEEVVDENVDELDPEESQEETDTGSNEDTEVINENEESPSEGEIDYKAAYEELFSPMKASGREIHVKSVEDAKNLIKMGFDYSVKMRDIKPLRPIAETLKRAGIISSDGVIDEQALTRLIDINNGNKEAIAQLIKEKQIDPLDMDIDEVNYTPESRIVSNHEVELKEVEETLASNGTIDIVVSKLNELDPQSKQYFTQSPSDLLKLEQDIKTGVYDEIMGVVQYEKSLGRLNGMSDIDAYIQVATAKSAQEQQAQAQPKTQVESAPKVSRSKRKAAGISKRPPANKQKKTYDFLNMSDDEFEKLIPQTGLY